MITVTQVLNRISRTIKGDNPQIEYKSKANMHVTSHKGITNKAYSIVSSDYFGMDIRLVMGDQN